MQIKSRHGVETRQQLYCPTCYQSLRWHRQLCIQQPSSLMSCPRRRYWSLPLKVLCLFACQHLHIQAKLSLISTFNAREHMKATLLKDKDKKHPRLNRQGTVSSGRSVVFLICFETEQSWKYGNCSGRVAGALTNLLVQLKCASCVGAGDLLQQQWLDCTASVCLLLQLLVDAVAASDEKL